MYARSFWTIVLQMMIELEINHIFAHANEQVYPNLLDGRSEYLQRRSYLNGPLLPVEGHAKDSNTRGVRAWDIESGL